MKMRHDVDATTLTKRTRAKVAGAALTVLVVAGAASTAAPVNTAMKMRHDCCVYRPVK